MIPYHADRIAQRVLICCTIQRTIVPVSAREHADARRRSLGATTFPLKGVLCYACRTPAFGRNPVESLRLRIQLACFRHARLLASASALGRAVRIVGHLRRVRVGTNVSRIPLVPSSPPAPFSHKGRRGSLGVLLPETGDGTPGLANQPAPARTRAPEFAPGARASPTACAPEARAPRKGRVPGRDAPAFPCAVAPSSPPAPFSHKGRRGSLGVLLPETGDGTPGLPQKPATVSPPIRRSPTESKGMGGVLMPHRGRAR